MTAATRRGFKRVRVSVNVSKPLKRMMKMTKRDGGVAWVTFKYERLTTFYFFCGMIGHTDKFCSAALDSSLQTDQYPYGPFLRASNRRVGDNDASPWLVKVDPISPTEDTLPVVTPAVSLQRVEVSSCDVLVEPKRKRGDEESCSVAMVVEFPNILSSAGTGSQARLPQ